MAIGESGDNTTTNLILKIVSIVVLFAMAIGFGIMPYFITSCRTSTKFLGLANAFSGGLFLGIGLFHILPESAEKLEGLTEAPIAYFIAFASYAIILFVEKIAFDSHSLVHKHEHGHENIQNSKEEDHKHELEHIQNSEEEHHKQVHEQIQNSEEVRQNANEPKIVNERNEEKPGIIPYILLLALGFHGLFEGMALGIQSKIQGTVFLLIAIVAHKWAASLTLGISFVKSKLSKKQLIIMVLIFALIGPVGIALGLILSSTANEQVEGILLAISTGTFLYIACSEVIIDEFENPNNKYFKFLMFILGGVFTAGLSLLELFSPEEAEENH